MSAFQASACLTFANILLAKVSQSWRGLQRCRTKGEFRKAIKFINAINRTNAVIFFYILFESEFKLKPTTWD